MDIVYSPDHRRHRGGYPLSRFELDTSDYARLAALDLSSVFVLEGGYAGARSGDKVAEGPHAFEAAA